MTQELAQLQYTLDCLNEQLNTSSSSDSAELELLKRDLEELIELKQEELLSAKKSELLDQIHWKLDDKPIELPCANNLSKWSCGQKCSVPGWTANGRFIWQNAIIGSLEEESDVMDYSNHHQSSSCVRVFLAHPTRSIDLPCPQFFQLKSCDRGVRCLNSHGTIISIEVVVKS